jgi:hypothetical protein
MTREDIIKYLSASKSAAVKVYCPDIKANLIITDVEYNPVEDILWIIAKKEGSKP